MERARGHSPHAATNGDQHRFDAVLGVRRGSASAQATRDAHESQVREDALTKMIAKLNVPSGSGTAFDRLVTAYRGGGARADTPEYKKLCKELRPSSKAVAFWDLAHVAAHGDPEHWPGLTGPAVDTVEAHLRAAADNGATDKLSRRVRAMIDAIAVYGNSTKNYEQLTPVLEGMAALLPQLPRGYLPARQMAEMLRFAPTQTLAGPLQPLVQAFRQRILDEQSCSDERWVLEQISADQVARGQVTEAFRPVADLL